MYAYPRLVKYRCHINIVGRLLKHGWSDQKRYRKVLKEDEFCPKCEKLLEKALATSKRWLQKRKEFPLEVINVDRDNNRPTPTPKRPSSAYSDDGYDADVESEADSVFDGESERRKSILERAGNALGVFGKGREPPDSPKKACI